MQINIGHLDAQGVYTGQYTTFALSGEVRARVRSTSSVQALLNFLALCFVSLISCKF